MQLIRVAKSGEKLLEGAKWRAASERWLNMKSGKQVLHNFHKIFHKQLEKWEKCKKAKKTERKKPEVKKRLQRKQGKLAAVIKKFTKESGPETRDFGRIPPPDDRAQNLPIEYQMSWIRCPGTRNSLRRRRQSK